MLPRFGSQRDKSATDLTILCGVLEFICYNKGKCVGNLTGHGRDAGFQRHNNQRGVGQKYVGLLPQDWLEVTGCNANPK